MRTVTFSDEKVAAELNGDFVSAWANRVPDFHNCESSTEEWIFTSTAEAYPTRNICTFFLTPDLQVVHYVGGYVAPDLFLEEAAFASKVRDECFDEGFAGRENSTERFVELHAARAAKIRKMMRQAGDYEALTDAMRPLEYGRQKHRHGGECATTLAAYYEYVAQIHDDFASDVRGTDQAHAKTAAPVARGDADATERGGVRINVTKAHAPENPRAVEAVEEAVFDWLPTLADLREDYRYGNPFAEEWTQKSVVRKRAK